MKLFCENCYHKIEDSVLSELFFGIKQSIEQICEYYNYEVIDDSTELVNEFDPFEVFFTFIDDTYSEDISVE